MGSLRVFLYSFVLLFILWSRFHVSHGLPDIIRIGGLFDSDDEEQEIAFRIAVDSVNSDEEKKLGDSRLVTLVARIDKNDSFDATKKFCNLLNSGIAAVFGPQSELISMHVQSMCDAMEVPHVVARWEHKLQRDDMSVNLYPQPTVLSKDLVQLVESSYWTKFYLLYEENEGIIRLQDFIKRGETAKWDVSVFQFPNSTSASYRSVFWDIKRSLDSQKMMDKDIEYKIILDVPRENLYEVLKAAQQVGMMTEKQKYLITSLDLHTIALEDFQYARTNLTGIRLIKETEEYQKLLREVNYRLRHKNKPPLKALKTESVLMYEAVKLFAQALAEMDEAKNIDVFPQISCTNMNQRNKGSDGTTLVNYMRSMKTKGITGKVIFDAEGFRSAITLDIMYLTDEGLQKIGSIMSDGKIDIARQNISSDLYFTELEHQHYIVTTIETDPFMMLKHSPEQKVGNDRYEGYTVDLLQELQELLHFDFTIKLVDDGNYGSNKTGEWNGMIKEVMDGKAHMAVADLTITSQREDAVDFTMPFVQTGISILFKKPTTKSTSLFSFLSPFSTEVWLYVMGAYTTISFILFMVGRLSPYEWSNPHPCRQNDLVEENNFSLLNTMWFTIGSLMQQGSDLVAGAPSTRTIASMWYFFNLIMISSYTANLAAFLTIENIIYPIRNAEDLSKQEKIKYGCVESGSTRSFFLNSNITTYKIMNYFMEKNKDEVLVKSNIDGKNKVKQGNYAFLMESTSISYITERECDLMQVGQLLDNKGYGVAVKKGKHKLRAWLSSGILKLQEDGKLHTLKERWWKQKRGGGKCAEIKSSAVNELGLANVGGVFVVMLLGLLLATIVAVLEFLWFSRKVVRHKQEPLWKLLLKEMKFAATCGSSVKPAPKLKKTEKLEKKTPTSSTPPSYNALY